LHAAGWQQHRQPCLLQPCVGAEHDGYDILKIIVLQIGFYADKLHPSIGQLLLFQIVVTLNFESLPCLWPMRASMLPHWSGYHAAVSFPSRYPVVQNEL
jgi:hypothetical protein